MSTIIEDILRQRLVAIIRMEHYDQAVQVAQALVAGGISVIEFTLTGTGAHHAIASTRETLGERAHIGVGTVLNQEAAQEAIAAGAQFVVTPVVQEEVIELCQARSVPLLCGAFTPTEALRAHQAGADLIKIFPARLGGPAYIRDLLAPLPHVRLVPTGGIHAQNASAYLQAGAVALGIGGNLVPREAVATGDWARITSLARECVQAVQASVGEAN